MNKSEFMKDLEEQLETNTALQLSTNIKKLEEWSSINAMILISYITENFNVILKAKDLEEITTVESLITKIGNDKFSE